MNQTESNQIKPPRGRITITIMKEGRGFHEFLGRSAPTSQTQSNQDKETEGNEGIRIRIRSRHQKVAAVSAGANPVKPSQTITRGSLSGGELVFFGFALGESY